MKRSSGVIAAAVCVAMLICACTAPEDKEEKKESVANTGQQTEEKEYQGKLDLIEPSAYNNVEGLQLEPGSYISVIGKDEDSQYWNEVKAGAEQAAKDINERLGYEGKDKIKVTYSAPATADDVDEQVNILDEELARYPVALGIAIADANACEVQFDLAAESDIPIVAFDSGSDYQGLMATVATDNQTAAREAAGKLAEAIDDSGEIALFVHDSKSMTAVNREDAFKEEIQNNHPNITIANVYHMDQLSDMQQTVADEINAGTYKKGQKEDSEDTPHDAELVTADSITEEEVVDYIFAKHPDLKGCYATNGTAVQFTLDGLERNKVKDIELVGFDADEQEIEALEDGKVTGLIVQNPFGMGYATVVASARASLDMGNEAFVNTGYTWVTKDNLKEESVQEMLY